MTTQGAWYAVDGGGNDPATGRAPAGRGAPSPAAALAAVPVATWPLRLVADDGREMAPPAALGAGGSRVVEVLERLVTPARLPGPAEVARLARATPAGRVDLPVAFVSLAAAVLATGGVDPSWLGEVERRRSLPRARLRAAGREVELEAALNLAMLVGTDPVADATDGGDAGTVDRTASGARLWLLGPGVAWALTGAAPDPFGPWLDLVSWRVWPVGPVGGRLLLAIDDRASDRAANLASDRASADASGRSAAALAPAD